MFLTDVTSGGAMPMLEKSIAFAEARNKVLADNIANVTTPGYRTKQLDVKSFQAALQKASEARNKNGGALKIDATDEVSQDAAGHLQVQPSLEPTQNLLSHDGTNARIERLMADLAENTMAHQASTELLKGYFDGVSKAIRGRIQ